MELSEKSSSVGNPQVSKAPSPVSNNDRDTSVCSFPVREEGKCLEYLWRPNLSSIRMVEELTCPEGQESIFSIW